MPMKWSDNASLRALAEQAAVGSRPPPDPSVSREELVNELLVHQTELEMQNEALRDMQAELHASSTMYRDLFENAPVGYLLLDRTSRIKVANATAVELLGVSAPLLAGVRLSRFLLPDEAIAFERYRREVIRTSTRLAAEFRIKDPKGREREMRLDGQCTNPETGDFRVTITDVTAQNETARRLDHSERLAALGRNASAVAHNLNNVLYSILGYAEVALGCLEPKDAAHAPVTRLGELVRRCAEATDQLTAFSRAETSQSGVVDLNSEIAGMESVIRPLLGADITLELCLTASDSAVRLDAAHIEQIVLNCVRNARQAMPRGGTFLIETASIELDGPSQGQDMPTRFVRWSMSDTGVGMTESTRQRAFEMFFTTKPPGGGTGLGLAMVKAAVERAGGIVALESELGHGTAVVIHLPRASGFARSPVEGEIDSRGRPV
jgi:two-component system cell cycle sensor histidine kinase/response regulator CckA